MDTPASPPSITGAASYFDTHCHLTLCKIPIAEHVREAAACGIACIFDPGLKVADLDERLLLTTRKDLPIPIRIGAAIAPHSAFLPASLDDDLATLAQYAKKNLVHGIGETGLEYHHPPENASRKVQLDLLAAHIGIAEEATLPLILHLRSGPLGNAYMDAAELLRRSKPSIPVISHCFTGDEKDAKAMLDCGAFLSFSGIITFKSAASSLQEIVRHIPAERILVETDAPYLAPVPMRGRANKSPYLIHTQNFMATLRKSDPKKLAEQIFTNANKIFMPPQL